MVDGVDVEETTCILEKGDANEFERDNGQVAPSFKFESVQRSTLPGYRCLAHTMDLPSCPGRPYEA
jgi:hypothetical protein